MSSKSSACAAVALLSTAATAGTLSPAPSTVHSGDPPSARTICSTSWPWREVRPASSAPIRSKQDVSIAARSSAGTSSSRTPSKNSAIRNATGSSLDVGGCPGRRLAGDLAEDRAGHHSRAGRVIPVPQAAQHLAGGVQAGNRAARGVLHLSRARIDQQAAEGERDAAPDAVDLKRAFLDADRV